MSSLSKQIAFIEQLDFEAKLKNRNGIQRSEVSDIHRKLKQQIQCTFDIILPNLSDADSTLQSEKTNDGNKHGNLRKSSSFQCEDESTQISYQKDSQSDLAGNVPAKFNDGDLFPSEDTRETRRSAEYRTGNNYHENSQNPSNYRQTQQQSQYRYRQNEPYSSRFYSEYSRSEMSEDCKSLITKYFQKHFTPEKRNKVSVCKEITHKFNLRFRNVYDYVTSMLNNEYKIPIRKYKKHIGFSAYGSSTVERPYRNHYLQRKNNSNEGENEEMSNNNNNNRGESDEDQFNSEESIDKDFSYIMNKYQIHQKPHLNRPKQESDEIYHS